MLEDLLEPDIGRLEEASATCWDKEDNDGVMYSGHPHLVLESLVRSGYLPFSALTVTETS